MINKKTEEARNAILAFLRESKIDLPASAELANFIDHGLQYLSIGQKLESFAAQDAMVRGQLVPSGKKDDFVFSLAHDVTRKDAPMTLQISATSGDFHALVIKQNCGHLEGYERQRPFSFERKNYRMGVTTERIRSDVDLAGEHPVLHTLKKGCAAEGMPVIYVLGDTRRQAKAVAAALAAVEERFGEKMMIGIDARTESRESAFGAPRISLQAGGAAQREKSSFEVSCAREWGDDTPVLAAASDGALVFRPYDIWTRIVVENLLAQKKPFAVVDNAAKALLPGGETQREIASPRGSYVVYADAADAAHALVRALDKGACARPAVSAKNGPETRLDLE